MSNANSPFNWRERSEPSIFAKDLHFRPRQSKLTYDEREKQLTDYKQFGVYSKAQPGKRDNKHGRGAPAEQPMVAVRPSRRTDFAKDAPINREREAND